jgi:hypothetical protein
MISQSFCLYLTTSLQIFFADNGRGSRIPSASPAAENALRHRHLDIQNYYDYFVEMLTMTDVLFFLFFF